jgi:DNA invertase Pin-like site-specific DNA recombinase
MGKAKRVAVYTRVSTGEQTTANQAAELKAWAERSGHAIVKVYEDKGVSGSKGRDKRPAFDAMLKAAVRREFDMLAVWSSDRLGRSLQHLIDVLQTIRDTGIGLYIHTQALDTTTPAGRAMFGMLAVFGEFEREMIVARVNAGLARARQSGTRSGKAIGRPKGADYDHKAIRAALLNGRSVRQAAKATGASVGTIAAVRKQLVAEDAL